MTKEEVLKAIEEIERISHDDEAAHIKEDELYLKFISDVAKRKDEIGEVARTVLLTKDIEFYRFYI